MENKKEKVDTEKIQFVSPKQLYLFKDHPFKMRNGEENEQLLESIRCQGTIEPLIVRPINDGKYEIVSGHRRYKACVELGIVNIPVILRNLTNEQAIAVMVDANIHRENILPSEKAFAYKMKLDAIKSQGIRTDLTFSQPAKRLNSSEVIASSFGIGKDMLYRYIRLTELIPPLIKLVDDGKIALTPAVELSYLTKEEQHNLMSEIEYSLSTPSLSQAQRMHSLSRQGRLSKDAIYIVMSEEKANQKEQVRFMKEDIAKYFPKNYTSKDMSEVIVKLLQNWQRKRERTSKEER